MDHRVKPGGDEARKFSPEMSAVRLLLSLAPAIRLDGNTRELYPFKGYRNGND
jgi:hypothetical protein